MSERTASDGLGVPETLVAMTAATVRARPDAVAVIDEEAPSAPLTYAALWTRAVHLAEELGQRGVVAGDCVGVYLPNWSDAIIWQIAADALDAHVIGINTRYGTAEVAHVLDRARPRVVAVAHGFRGLPLGERLLEAMQESGYSVPSVAVVPGPGAPAPAPEEAAAYGEGAWVPATPAKPAPFDPARLGGSPDALAVAFTTSGSTGKPKLAAHTSANVVHHSVTAAAWTEMGPDSVSLMALPVSGVLAFVPAWATLAAGGSIVMQPSFDGRQALSLMAAHRVTHLCGADDITGRIRAAWAESEEDLSAFQRLMIADFYGQSLEIAEWFETVSPCRVIGVFGSSEVFAWLTLRGPGETTPQRWRPGGHPISSRTELRFVDPVTGDQVAEGEPGELLIRGYGVVDAYLGDHDGSVLRKNVDPEGWFRTGDLCSAEGDGGMSYLCRLGDSLRLKGFLVEPIEIESVIAEMEGVDRVKVVGIDGPDGTRAVAFVTARAGHELDGTHLHQQCTERLARFKVPDAVHVLDDLPTTVGTNGAKIKAAALRDLAAELHAVSETREKGK